MKTRRPKAFSLLEVVAAIGVFAVGMIAVLGLFTPTAKSVGEIADADASSKVASAVRTKLQSLGPAALVPLLKNAKASGHELTEADARPDYDLTKDPQLLFVSRDGTNMFDYFDTPVSSCYYPLLDAGERIAGALVKAVEGAGVNTLQFVEQTEFIQRPHRTRGETL